MVTTFHAPSMFIGRQVVWSLSFREVSTGIPISSFKMGSSQVCEVFTLCDPGWYVSGRLGWWMELSPLHIT